VQAQPSGTPATSPPPVTTLTVTSGSVVFTGSAGGGVGSGLHPNLQNAYVALIDAQDELRTAQPDRKGDYLPRAMTGVQMALADVLLAIDNADGRPMPPASSLRKLPPGVGNAASGLTVVPLTNPKIASPHMDNAAAALNKALRYLKATTPGNKGIYLSRAEADVQFAIDNAYAAVNLANGFPPSQSKSAMNPAQGNSAMSFSANELIGLAVLVIAAVALLLEQLFRARLGR
jgi:hypothetical protein